MLALLFRSRNNTVWTRLGDFTRIYNKSEFAPSAELHEYQLHRATSQWRLTKDANSRQSFDLSRPEPGHAHRSASFPPPYLRSNREEDEPARRRNGGGQAQRHRREIHPAARETLPLRGDSEISLQPEFYNRCCGKLLPREFSRAFSNLPGIQCSSQGSTNDEFYTDIANLTLRD